MIEDEYIIDFERRRRLGIVEAIWGEHKTVKQISEILRKFQIASEIALVTRVSPEKGKELLKEFPSAKFHSKSGCLTIGELGEEMAFS